MLKIYFSFIHQLPPDEAVLNKLHTLPLSLQQKIRAYKNPWDRVLQLCSKLLLQELIHQFKLDNMVRLDDLQLSKNGKPHFNNALYFSTAHSGKIAVCTACTDGDVGIDIEEIRPVDLPIYEEYFTAGERKKIAVGENSTESFYKLWTRKEAVLKASGSGIHEDLASFEVLDNTITLTGTNYYLQEITVAEGYVCHVASTVPNLKVELTAFEFFEE